MRFGSWRGVMLACLLAVAATGAPASANDTWIKWNPVIPREVPAVDANTGGPLYAPPVPFGEYAKDYLGCIHGAVGCLSCYFHGGLCHKCRAKNACGNCGGAGCGLCGKGGHGHRQKACGACGGAGCGLCGHGGGHLGHGAVIDPGLGLASTAGGVVAGGLGAGAFPGGTVFSGGATFPGGTPLPGNLASPQCSGAGCLVGADPGKHCGHCRGKGCGLCRDPGGPVDPGACSKCGGKGCGLCGKGGHGKKVCNNCGGKGCGLCSRLGGLFHHNRIRWFVGAGGPVPLTPGYVPYVVPVRSPRDYFSFPPYNGQVP